MMNPNTPYPITPEPQSLRTMLLLIGFILLGGAIGGVLAVLLLGVASATGGSEVSMIEVLQAPDKVRNGWWWLMVVQAVSHVCSFLLPALFYWHYFDRRRLSAFNLRPAEQVSGWLLAALVVVTFMPFDGLVIEWNQQISLPPALKPLEQWMRDKEDAAAALTKFMTSFKTMPQLIVAILMVGVIAAVGEEVLFRGLLQRKFIAWTGNVHAGVWIAAAVFSAIHVQFYGFVPRMLLGALFGYLFVWSGNLWVPILAHFVNNSFTVVMFFLYQNKFTSFNVEDTESVPLLAAVSSLLVTGVLLVLFRRANQPSGFA